MAVIRTATGVCVDFILFLPSLFLIRDEADRKAGAHSARVFNPLSQGESEPASMLV